MSKPIITPGQWISIGAEGKVDAVVCNVYKNRDVDAEVVYLNDLKKAINEDVVWVDDCWNFAINRVCGGYADNYSRLSGYIKILRKGKY